jgi:hypothetical protein
MMTVQRKRLIRDLAATGVAAPFVILLLILAQAAKFLVWVLMPILYLGQAITSLIVRICPSHGGGELAGFGMVLIVDFVLAWIVVWIILFALVKLIQKCINWKKREA